MILADVSMFRQHVPQPICGQVPPAGAPEAPPEARHRPGLYDVSRFCSDEGRSGNTGLRLRSNGFLHAMILTDVQENFVWLQALKLAAFF